MKPRSYTLTKKTIILISFIFIFLRSPYIKSDCTFPTSRKFVNGCNATRILCLSKKIGNTLDEVRHSIGEVILANTTISSSGHYILGQPVESPIIIDSDDVSLDLNGYEICATGSAIIINENKKNILIKNGSLVGAQCCEFTCSESNLINASGILVKQGCHLIQIASLNILGFAQGILLDGSETTSIESCDISDTILYCNNKGIVLNYTIKSTFKSNEALNCYESGFELYKSQFNCFDKCRAIETKNDTATKQAVGFLSTSGNCNLFYECVSNGSEKTSSNFGYNSIGFLLNGTPSQPGETKTEIVACIANKGAITEDANIYGIHLDAILKAIDPLGTVSYTHDTDRPINTTAWSPESRFIAIGQDYIVTDSSLKILSLYGSTLSVYARAYPNTQNVLATAWDPKGTYLAVGTANDGAGDEFFIYEFDPNSPSTSFLKTVTSFNIGAAINSIEWSPDGKAIAIGADSGAIEEEIQVWGFENSTATISSQPIASQDTGANVLGVAFSPDGKYLAAIYTDTIDVYSFRCLATDALTLKTSETAYGGSLKGVDWSPIACCSKYFIAVCGTANANLNMQIFTYDGDTTLTSFETDFSLGTSTTINCITWSPNGKYLLTGGERTSNLSTEIFSFDASANADSRTTTKDKGAAPHNANACTWSPSGRYAISAGDDSTTGGTASIYESAHVPLKCVIKYSELLNNTGGLCGTGIEGSSGENLIIKNIGYENNINFSAGVFNKYEGGLNGSPTLLQNISIPPYEN